MKPLTFRLWHWLNAFAILGLLATVLLRKTFLSWRTNAALIQEKITAAGGQIEADLAKKIAQAVRDPMWDWHYVFGFALAALFVVRLVVLWRHPSTRPTLAGLDLHHKIVRVGYAVFYAMTLFMVASGLAMYFKDTLGLGRGFVDILKEAHEVAMLFFVLFTAAHVAGVVVAENRDEPGLISRMIHGRDEAPRA